MTFDRVTVELCDQCNAEVDELVDTFLNGAVPVLEKRLAQH